MTFESIYKRVIKEMERQGKVKNLSLQQTYSIDNNLAEGLAPIKQEFYKKQNASRSYISKLELKTVVV